MFASLEEACNANFQPLPRLTPKFVVGSTKALVVLPAYSVPLISPTSARVIPSSDAWVDVLTPPLTPNPTSTAEFLYSNPTCPYPLVSFDFQ